MGPCTAYSRCVSTLIQQLRREEKRISERRRPSQRTHTLVWEEKYSRACGRITVSSLLTDVSRSLLTCRQNTFSWPRRGWMQAPEENLGAGEVSEVMTEFS